MAASTRAAVMASTLRVRLMTWETVVVETPARRATSRMVVTGRSPVGRTWLALTRARAEDTLRQTVAQSVYGEALSPQLEVPW